MSKKPKIYGFCQAGCKWETIHREELENSAAFLQVPIDDTTDETILDESKTYAIESYYNAYESYSEKNDAQKEYLPLIGESNVIAMIDYNVYVFQANEIYKCDFTAGTHTIITSTLSKDEWNIIGGCAVVVGTKIYVMGSIAVPNIQVFDTATNEFSVIPFNNGNVITDLTAVAIANQIYIFGGKNESDECKCLFSVLDTDDLSVTSFGASPSNLYGMRAANVGEQIYLFGGRYSDNNYISENIYVCDTFYNTISKIPYINNAVPNVPLITEAAPVAFGTKIYLFGGLGEKRTSNTLWSGVIDNIQIFDTVNRTMYLSSKKIKRAARGLFVSLCSDGEILCVGGYEANPSGLIYDKANIWATYKPIQYNAKIKVEYNNGKEYCFPIDVKPYHERFTFKILGVSTHGIQYQVDNTVNDVFFAEELDVNLKYKISNARALYIVNEDARVAGKTGADGNSVFIRYSANEDGTDFTATWQSGQNYIGFAVGQEAPTEKTGYTWSLFSAGDVETNLNNLIALQEQYINS